MKVIVTDQVINIKLTPLDKVVSLKSSFSIPLVNIKKATAAVPKKARLELRSPGTFVPGVIKAGTYYTKAGREFWYLRRRQHALILELRHAPYSRIVVGTREAQHWANVITKNLHKKVVNATHS